MTAQMGKVVSFINMKGGVGKTTLAVALAWQLAQRYRVLLIDIDPQFNATQWLVETDTYMNWLNDRSKRTVFDVYQPDGASGAIGGFRPIKKRAAPSLANCVMQIVHGGASMDILPSTLELITLDAAPRGTENRLKGFTDVARHKYDYILIDCPPTSSLFSLSAYIASDCYLVPIKPDPLSALGLPLLERALQDYESRSGKSIERLGLVLTLVRGTDAMTRTSRDIRSRYPGEVFHATLSMTTGVAEAVEACQPPQLFSKTKAALRQPLESMSDEFVTRMAKI